MTTVYLSPDADRLGTHVLIVGIGAYTHLIGGTDQADNPLCMEQLSSPAVSARAMINWFLGPILDAAAPGFRNQASPLLSLEALIASEQPEVVQSIDGPVPLDGGRLDEVRVAYERWRTRLIAHPGSTGIFYFCGHGLSATQQYALCQDLLCNEGVPYEKVFEIEGTLHSLCKEAADCDIHFWFDACRTIEPALLFGPGRPYPLRQLDPLKPSVERSHSLLQATGTGMPAFSKKEKPSRFTQALLNSLSGYAGASRPGNRWEVGSAELHKSVGAFLAAENKSAKRKQSCAHETWGEGNAIVELDGPPKVKLFLDLSPEAMKPHGQLFYQQCNGAAQKSVHQCSAGSLCVDIDAGYYNLGAEATQGQFQPKVYSNQMVSPPLWDHVFEVGP